MAKQTQMAKVSCYGEIRVIKLETVDHPYRVIKTWHDNGKRTKQLYMTNSYEDAIRYIWGYVVRNYDE